MTPLLFWGLPRLFSPEKECHLRLGSPGKDGSIFSIFSIKLDWLLKVSELAASLVLTSGCVRPLEGPERLWVVQEAGKLSPPAVSDDHMDS